LPETFVAVHSGEGAGGGVPRPQTFAMPPLPQVCGAVQAPQVSVPPQPSGTVPQFLPCAAQVVGVHAGGGVPRPQTLAIPPPPQVCGAVQAPQKNKNCSQQKVFRQVAETNQADRKYC